jgi:hypothetical protein
VFNRSEKLNNKGFAAAEICLGASNALFVSTHFDAKDGGNKAAQLLQLGKALSSLPANVRFSQLFCTS